MIRSCAVLGSICLVAVLGWIAPASASAQDPEDAVADQPLATRQALDNLARHLTANGNTTLLTRVRSRLTEGDFPPGARVLLMVQGQDTLSDTFVVNPARDLMLPSPTVGTLSMKGVLRSELEGHMQRYLARFLERPVIQARPLIRLSVQGEVENAGVYPVPADAALSDALMAAGGMTQFAKLKKIKIERDGERIWEGHSFDVLINDIGLRDGDQIVVDSNRRGLLTDNLRFAALIVSIIGGVYGLTRAF